MRAYHRAGMLWEISRQAGTRELYPIAYAFIAAPNPRTAAVGQLLLFCALAPLVYTVVRRATRWSPQDAFWAAMLTALAPLDFVRFVAVTVAYVYACVCFAGSLVLLLRDLDEPRAWRRLLALLFLLLSFATNSILTLAWLPPALVAIDACRRSSPTLSLSGRLTAAILAVLRRSELLVAAPLFWATKKVLEPTYGLYANYNKFQIGVGEALQKTVVTFIDQFRGAGVLLPERADLMQLCIAAAVVVLIVAGAIALWRLPVQTRREASTRSWIADLSLVAILFALLLSALFPYVLVDKAPRFYGLWETRNQTTLMLVSGFVLYSLMRLVVPRPLLSAVAALVAVGFLILDISVTHRILVDAQESRAITKLFAEDPPKPGTMLFVIESDRNYRALGRAFAFYELSFLVKAGDLSRPQLAVSNREVLDPETRTYPTKLIPAATEALISLCENHRSRPQFGFGGFVSNGTVETVAITSERDPPGLFRTLGDTVRGAVASVPPPTGLIRLVRNTTPIGGACLPPCCSAH